MIVIRSKSQCLSEGMATCEDEQCLCPHLLSTRDLSPVENGNLYVKGNRMEVLSIMMSLMQVFKA